MVYVDVKLCLRKCLYILGETTSFITSCPKNPPQSVINPKLLSDREFLTFQSAGTGGKP